jgi:DNA-directed RNA polymerase subunit K/omega
MIMKKTDSRGSTIDTQKCLENVGGNRFEMVLIASVRAREIARRNKSSDRIEHTGAQVSALLDIQNGKVDRFYLKKV